MRKILVAVPLLLSSLFITITFSANILVLYPGSGKSHKISVMPIVEELAERGHRITIVSPYPTSTKSKNIKDIFLPDAAEYINNMVFERFEAQKENPLKQLALLLQELESMVRVGYESMMKNAEFLQILEDRQIDVIIQDGLMSEYCRVISHHLQVPFIAHYSMAVPSSMDLSQMGTSADFAIIPNGIGIFTNEMTFFQRVLNTIQTKLLEMFYNYAVIRVMNEMTHEDFPDSPTVEELGKEMSLMIINSHPVISYTRSLPPTVIPIGALHTRHANPLPMELEKFVADSDNGFILFTLGSYIKGSSIPKKALQSFINIFAKLPQKIIWKWEDEAPENIPKNILLSKWLPQQDLLGHPKCKLFITHGGMQGTLEAIYHAVPLLCLPLGADRDFNCFKAEKEGYAVLLDWNHINDDSLKEAFERLNKDPTFKKNATRVSSLIRDEIVPGKDVGAYWVEHVLRHGGTKHLQSAGKDMPFYRFYLLDVFAFLSLVLLILLFATYRFIRWIVRKIFLLLSTVKKNKLN